MAVGVSARTDRTFRGPRGQRPRKLRIEAVRGRPLIEQVIVEFFDAPTQRVELNTPLPQGSGEIIDLNRGAVRKITVYTDRQSAGAYSIYST
jgi:hypothetical protein